MKPDLRSIRSFLESHRRAALVLAALALVALVGVGLRLARSSDVQYFTARVERGDVRATVTATGTINALTTVQVGSQVSGQIAELHADFNSQVPKGQIIALIEQAPFRTHVLQAEADLANAEAGVKSLEADWAVADANLDKARVGLREAELNRKRTLELFEQGIASTQQRDAVEIAFETAEANLEAATAQLAQVRARVEQQRAQVRQRQAQLEAARLDLEHTVIRAPIEGTVIARNVDVGQTVAASLQAPTLFTIAQDLRKMLVYAKTDESDVGKIRPGAEASFKVDSFPDRDFSGTVTQVRMNAYQVQNVVTYDTIVEFENSDLRLLPGMTAYVTIPIASALDVVKIPNGALRYKPEMPEEERRALLEKYGLLRPAPAETSGPGTVQAQEASPASARAGGESGLTQSPDERAARREQWRARRQQENAGAEGQRPVANPRAEGSWQIVWKLSPDRSLRPVRVKVGLTDYTFTALLEGDLAVGDPLVIGQTMEQQSRSPLSGGMPRRF